MSAVRVLFVTAPDGTVARAIARTLVEERLAACVSTLPGVESVYRWQGKIEEAREVLLVIKTVHERVPALMVRVKELHPYEVPEVIALPVEAALPAYAAWVLDATGHVVT